MLVPATKEITRDAFGGQGGGGGDSGFEFPNADDGAHGLDGFPFDGADGQPGDQYTGMGGAAGANGSATASGTSVGDAELMDDLLHEMGYSWIHNQWADLELSGAGGGGGGGAGSDVYDLYTYNVFYAGVGGDGGNGDGAAGTVTVTQASDVDYEAEAIVNPAWPPGTPPPATVNCSIEFTMGWVSAVNPNWSGGGSPIWARNINMNIIVGNTAVNVAGGPASSVVAFGTDDLGNIFYKPGADLLSSDIGSFGFGPGEVGTTVIGPGQTASIAVAPGDPISSILSGGMSVLGGIGGGGAFPGNGDGDDGPNDLGAAGGAGGAGGITEFVDLNNDGYDDLFIAGDGDGGEGGDGEEYIEHKDGIYEGYVIVRL